MDHLDYKQIECTVHKYSPSHYAKETEKYSKTIVDMKKGEKTILELS